ncbi:MAG: pyridoxal phosphate-dependent aminotransferase [Fibromonadaceae bacterium]|nr:pyridoxal phosphate-dependent aminotransferase [Fibromonadaceae bacterium]
MKYDFDSVIDRRNTYSIKFDPILRGKPSDVQPMWVADMDFATPPCVIDALVARAKHGIYGYSEPDAEFFSVVQKWFRERFDWNVERKWLIATPGVVSALYIAVRALTKPSDGVLIQQPVYPPFESSVKQTGRKLLVNELVYSNGHYSIDFQDFENKIKDAELFILCNPHNPVGRVWREDELMRMGEICLRHGVIVISDEIHQDFIYPEHRHIVFTKLDPRFADITLTCTSPSKTFNLAGLLYANIFISNEKLFSRFEQEYTCCGLSQPSLMGMVSCKAAYESGAEWVDELKSYLCGNMSFIKEFLKERIPKIKLVEPEGTYLAWLDFLALGLSAQELNDLITHKAKLWLNDGPSFGLGGKGFQRMNAACPRSALNKALESISSCFS